MNKQSIPFTTTLLFTLMIAACSTPTTIQDPIASKQKKAEQQELADTAVIVAKPPLKIVKTDIAEQTPEHDEVEGSHALQQVLPVPDQQIPDMELRREHRLPVKPGYPAHHRQRQIEKQRIMTQHIPPYRQAQESLDRENYQHFEDNAIKLVNESPVSTFSVDVDTASYANVRRMLNGGRLPRRDAVRIEELINYFNYDYPVPEDKEAPFSVTTELAVSPWNANNVLMQVGLKGYDTQVDNLPPANLVFLIDVSGSMRANDKLPLLKKSLKLLVNQMRRQDSIAIVVYAGASGTVLEPTSGKNKHKIIAALDNLQAGGSTNGASGINLAYQVAASAMKDEGINRVILCTDGDFNVGTTNFNALMDLVEEKRQSGVEISTLGFGRGNLNDHLAEQLANRGNGSYNYIDSLKEAQKVLHQQMSSSLLTIAKDVKIQVEFNPARVSSYRLIGYVNRKLKREDFNNDKVDAGEIGAGHTVTALYELSLKGSKNPMIDSLRYQDEDETRVDKSQEVAFVKVRYKQPKGSRSQLLTFPVEFSDDGSNEISERMAFSASVAAFGQRLRGGKHLHDFGWNDILSLARQGKGEDENGYRGEFIQLVNLARSLDTPPQHANVE